MGYPPRHVNRQTPVKTVPSLVLRTQAVNITFPHPSDAVGKNLVQILPYSFVLSVFVPSLKYLMGRVTHRHSCTLMTIKSYINYSFQVLLKNIRFFSKKIESRTDFNL